MTVIGRIATGNGHDAKALRQRAIRDLIAARPIGSQGQLVEARGEQGFAVTQATVSRDITELGLIMARGAGGQVYVAPESVASPTAMSPSDERLERILADIPVASGRSGRILGLTGTGQP